MLSKERANTRLTARVRTCGDRDTRFWLVAATPDATVEILDRLDHLARTKAPELVAKPVLDFLSLDRSRRDAIAGCLDSRRSRLLRSG